MIVKFLSSPARKALVIPRGIFRNSWIPTLAYKSDPKWFWNIICVIIFLFQNIWAKTKFPVISELKIELNILYRDCSRLRKDNEIIGNST